ncbi:MAG: hypothetical protein K8I03_00975 [Ignavibacteria bacterium]|nr:hypothetical protein [Ignavibacteria bacterium]
MFSSFSNIGIGTSMLFNGVLKSGIDDNKRELLLKKSINSGLNVIHTNAKLGTQERVCRILKELGGSTFHITKVQSTIEPILKGDNSFLNSRLLATKRNCACNKPYAVSIEVDHGVTNLHQMKKKVLEKWLEKSIFSIFDYLEYQPKIGLMCKSQIEFETAITSKLVDFVGGYTNILQTGMLVEVLCNNPEKPVIGFSPFSRGRIFEIEKKHLIIKILAQNKLLDLFDIPATFDIDSILKTISFKIALSCPNIKSLITGIYSFESLEWVQNNSFSNKLELTTCKDVLKIISPKNHPWI